ncbi:hypothetical protein DK419_13115 [Methylobacterium terrae]|uniref:Uncharacterized protein n=1 Tax=Methylobacterium terrae TaxID=2202827 RepID=A0A2U8WPB3_9HYPH|nr:hypothetical protein [Methylobacterium terrae]AWN47136.1 hypothetical protein DK419_13115 [Methylobacterium terrae]
MAHLLLGGLAKTISKALGPVFLPATLARAGETTGDAWNPTPGAPIDFRCRALRDEWGTYHRSNGLVAAADWKILVLAETLKTEPREGDLIQLPNTPQLIVYGNGEGQPGYQADPATACWILRCHL